MFAACLHRVPALAMSDFSLPFALPDIGEEEIAEVVDSLRSGWISTGPKVQAFEQRFAEFLGGDVHTVAVNSATGGMHLALEAVGLQPGDEVITTTFTFTATAEVIRYFGADPVLVDIDPGTLCIDPRAVEAKLSARTRGILPVHYGGLACDMESLQRIASSRELFLIEDAAHALPTRADGELVGALDTTAAVFSFYATKPLATGEGGMVATRDPDLAARVRTMRLHGMSRDAFDRYVSDVPAWRYDIVAPGYKYNMTDVAASMGLHQLAKAARFAARRTEIAEAYDDGLVGLPLELPPRPRGLSTHAWHLYVIRLDRQAPVTRDRFIELMSERGIGCSVHYVPLHLHSYWRDRYKLSEDEFPAAQATFECCVSLPIYTRMSNDDVARVIDATRAILGQ